MSTADKTVVSTVCFVIIAGIGAWLSVGSVMVLPAMLFAFVMSVVIVPLIYAFWEAP